VKDKEVKNKVVPAHNCTYHHTYNYMYIYSFFIVCSEFQVAWMQTKFCQSCKHHIKGWVGLSKVIPPWTTGEDRRTAERQLH